MHMPGRTISLGGGLLYLAGASGCSSYGLRALQDTWQACRCMGNSTVCRHGLCLGHVRTWAWRGVRVGMGTRRRCQGHTFGLPCLWSPKHAHPALHAPRGVRTAL